MNVKIEMKIWGALLDLSDSRLYHSFSPLYPLSIFCSLLHHAHLNTYLFTSIEKKGFPPHSFLTYIEVGKSDQFCSLLLHNVISILDGIQMHKTFISKYF